MKPIKMLGLAALAALLAMAFVGASSAVASSTELCSSEGEACETITHVHETSVGKGVLKSELPTIECTVLFLGDTEAGTSAPLVINGQFTYSACNNFCSVKEESAGAKIEVLRTASELASVTGKGLVNVKCPFINCNYVGTGLEGHALGPLTSEKGANGSVVLTEQLTEKESGTCPPEAFLTLTTTPLVPSYIREARTHYCVEYPTAKGLYLSVKSPCDTRDSTRAGKFALVSAKAGLAKGTVLCVDLYEKVGSFKNSACTEKEANGLYEKGTIQ
jgi:hypothetical protein